MADLDVIVCVAFDHRAPADGLQAFKDCITHCSLVASVLEVSGSFDLIVQASCTTLAEYSAHMEGIRPQIAEFVSRIETNFVSGRLVPRCNADENGALWLPCEGGRKRVEVHLVDKIVAEGDYMRVHVGTWNCMVHDTMRHLHEMLAGFGFIQLHRSSLVRIQFIDRLVHDDRRWNARLRDGSYVSVAKSHVPEILRLMSGESSMPSVVSSKKEQPVVGARTVNEMEMRLSS